MEVVGGVETYLRAVLPLLVESGFEIAVLAEVGVSADGMLAACPDVSTMLTGRKSIVEILENVSAWNPDVVYSHAAWESCRLEAELADRYPAVLFAHNYSGTCVSGTEVPHASGIPNLPERLSDWVVLPRISPRGGCGETESIDHAAALYRNERRRMGILNRYRAVLVASRHMAIEFRRHGVEDRRLKLVPLFPTE